jgi:antitoxin FitA
MTDVLIRDVPPEAVEVLRQRARDENKSMQAYLREMLLKRAEKPSMKELLDRYAAEKARSTNDVTTQSVLDDLDAGREDR